MDRFAQLTRIATVLAVLFTFGIASTTVGPMALDGQEGGDECVEEWEDEVGPCVELAHDFRGTCEGSACWTAEEWCCLPELVIVIQ
ncbi:hypothetical protein [Candidatus Palauibacter sp.]|uniref:hypothetical protein n=1 Tax=Candidatus Palauibacter sp. TaxID=3101350 RepID=UPI003B027BAC